MIWHHFEVSWKPQSQQESLDRFNKIVELCLWDCLILVEHVKVFLLRLWWWLPLIVQVILRIISENTGANLLVVEGSYFTFTNQKICTSMICNKFYYDLAPFWGKLQTTLSARKLWQVQQKLSNFAIGTVKFWLNLSRLSCWDCGSGLPLIVQVILRLISENIGANLLVVEGSYFTFTHQKICTSMIWYKFYYDLAPFWGKLPPHSQQESLDRFNKNCWTLPLELSNFGWTCQGFLAETVVEAYP